MINSVNLMLRQRLWGSLLKNDSARAVLNSMALYFLEAFMNDGYALSEDLQNEELTCEPEYEGDSRSTWWYACSECHGDVDPSDIYCRHCGRKIKWTTLKK